MADSENKMAELQSSDFLKRFVRHVCANLKRQKSAETARVELKNQLRKVKIVSQQNQKKWLIEREILVLERKIDEVLRHEIALLSLGKSGSLEIRQLRKDVDTFQNRLDRTQLNKQSVNTVEIDKADSMRNMLLEIKDKIDRLIEDKKQREKRISEIEQKVRRKSLVKSNALEIENRLRNLEGRYERIKNETDDYKALEIESKLNLLRAKVEGFR